MELNERSTCISKRSDWQKASTLHLDAMYAHSSGGDGDMTPPPVPAICGRCSLREGDGARVLAAARADEAHAAAPRVGLGGGCLQVRHQRLHDAHVADEVDFELRAAQRRE